MPGGSRSPGRVRDVHGRVPVLSFIGAAAMLALGGGAWLVDGGGGELAELLWLSGAVLGLLLSLAATAAAVRRRRPTVDVIAVLALLGAIAVEEYFAGAVIAVMLTTGQLLQARAERRARRELSLLLESSPSTAQRRRPGEVVEVPVDDVTPGERLVVLRFPFREIDITSHTEETKAMMHRSPSKIFFLAFTAAIAASSFFPSFATEPLAAEVGVAEPVAADPWIDRKSVV